MREAAAKSILIRAKSPEQWFGVEYNANLYRGCSHGCVYCDSRSECYGIEDFDQVTVKMNAPDLLRRELSVKRRKAVVGTGSMSDPYIPAERGYKMTRRMLSLLEEFGFAVHVTTKSDLVVRDLDILAQIHRKSTASVAFSITTCDEGLAAWAEPHAPSPAARLAAMEKLAERGLRTGVLLMPVLPFLLDQPAQVLKVAEKALHHGAQYIIPWFGMSLRDRQREYYYRKLDEREPGLRQRYERAYGARYTCSSPNAERLYAMLQEFCTKHGIGCRMSDALVRMPSAGAAGVEQMELF